MFYLKKGHAYYIKPSVQTDEIYEKIENLDFKINDCLITFVDDQNLEYDVGIKTYF